MKKVVALLLVAAAAEAFVAPHWLPSSRRLGGALGAKKGGKKEKWDKGGSKKQVGQGIF